MGSGVQMKTTYWGPGFCTLRDQRYMYETNKEILMNFHLILLDALVLHCIYLCLNREMLDLQNWIPVRDVFRLLVRINGKVLHVMQIPHRRIADRLQMLAGRLNGGSCVNNRIETLHMMLLLPLSDVTYPGKP